MPIRIPWRGTKSIPWDKDEILEFMESMESNKNKVELDDPRPPIKQRLGIEGAIGSCPFCNATLVHSDKRGEWICPFCEVD